MPMDLQVLLPKWISFKHVERYRYDGKPVLYFYFYVSVQYPTDIR